MDLYASVLSLVIILEELAPFTGSKHWKNIQKWLNVKKNQTDANQNVTLKTKPQPTAMMTFACFFETYWRQKMSWMRLINSPRLLFLSFNSTCNKRVKQHSLKKTVFLKYQIKKVKPGKTPTRDKFHNIRGMSRQRNFDSWPRDADVFFFYRLCFYF